MGTMTCQICITLLQRLVERPAIHDKIIINYRMHLAQHHHIQGEEIGKYIAAAELMTTKAAP
jgi:hypothetical protein